MSRIKRKDTKPELIVRKALFASGYRYRTSYKLRGKPDIVFPAKRIVIFIHGCFWHQHGCNHTYRPKTNKKFWNEKLDKNIMRDRKVRQELEDAGWYVHYIWECQINYDIDKVISLLKVLLGK